MSERRPDAMDDSLLSQLIDDALPADEASRLRRRLAAEPALARRFEEMKQANDAVHARYAGVVDEPLPDRLTALLTSRGVGVRPAAIELPAAPSRASWFGWPALLTATAALAAGFLIAFLILPRTAPGAPEELMAAGGLIPGSSAIHETLQRAASGEARAVGHGWSAVPRLSMIDVDGDPCRRLDLSRGESGLATLACRKQGAWRVELVEFGGRALPAEDGEVQPATGDEAPAIDAAIDRMIDGAPLGRAQEQALIAGGWSSGG